MALKIRPLDDRILVKQEEAEQVTAGGIVLPDTAKEKPQMGTVVAVGSGKMNKDGTRAAIEVKKGDKVFYGKYAGTEVKVDGNEYVIIRETDVLAIVAD